MVARWQATIVDEEGNVQAGASITVRREVSGAPLATIYSDRAGSVPIGNPFTTGPDGFAAFHAAGAAYRIDAVLGAFSRTWRYVGIGTASEFDLEDAEGLAVVQNVDSGFALAFETETSAPPSAGSIRFDNANLAAATEAYVSVENLGGSDIEARLLELFDVGRTVKDTFQLLDTDANSVASWRVTGAALVGSPGEYVTLSISTHAGETGFTDGTVLNFQPNRAGADGLDGEVPAARTLTAGAGLTGGGDLSANLTFAVGAGTGIVANADDVAVDKATNANARTAAPDKVLTADIIETASAAVALDGATPSTVPIDWETGFYFTVTITGNRTLANPTNGHPGTWRTVRVQGSDATDRTLTFGNQFTNELPTLTDIDSAQPYLLSVFCHSATEFYVYAQKAGDF